MAVPPEYLSSCGRSREAVLSWALDEIDMKIFKFSSDPWAAIIIALCLGLFVLALIVKGFTHDVLVEAAVFLVSLKLILMAKKNSETEIRLERHLTQISELLASKND